MSQTSVKHRAFSYLRFSTPEQSKGDSFRRQTSMADDYCRRHGLELDQKLSFHDLGVSAFRGQNLAGGKLAQFQEAVSLGLVPIGSFLLVESLDRVSRQDAVFAQMTLQSIVFSGVNLVTLTDGQLYSKERLISDPMSLIMSLLIFIRANEESQTKSRRLSAAWSNKKKLAASEKKPLTARTPSWIELNKERGRYELIPEKAKVVKWIFKKALSGMGRAAIAKKFNQDEVPVFGNGGSREGRRWYESYIAKILANPSTYGVCIPHVMAHGKDGKKSRKPLEPILDYFPKVITAEEFKEVNLLLDSKSPQRGRHASKGPASILAGLMRCPKCGSTMTRVYKGKRGGDPRLVCVKAKAGDGCKYHGVKIPPIEHAIFNGLPSILNEPPSVNDEDNKEVGRLSSGIDAMEDSLSTLLDDFASSGSLAVREKAAQYEQYIEEAKKKLSDLREWQEVSAGPLFFRNTTEAASLLTAEPKDILAINLSLRKLFIGIVVSFDEGILVFRWKSERESPLFYAFPDPDNEKKKKPAKK